MWPQTVYSRNKKLNPRPWSESHTLKKLRPWQELVGFLILPLFCQGVPLQGYHRSFNESLRAFLWVPDVAGIAALGTFSIHQSFSDAFCHDQDPFW